MSQPLHHRRSIRLEGYDYRSPGAYYITLAAHRHQCLFGRYAGEIVILNELSQAIAYHWTQLPRHFPVTLDTWIIMPDHFHAVVFLETDPAMDDLSSMPFEKRKGTTPGSLSAIVQNFKSLTTLKINRICSTPAAPVWQRNYYEHILRSTRELENARQYIADNPMRHFLKQAGGEGI